MKKLHITPVFCILCLAVSGQVNLKAGYCLSFVDAPAHDAMMAAHQQSLHESYTENFNSLDVLHGMDLGLEQRWETFALEAGWRIKRIRQVGEGRHTGTPFQNKLSFALGSFYGGIVQYLGPVRIAASIDYSYIRNKLEFEQPAEITVFKDDGWGSNFSLGFVLRGSGPVSLVIAPFAQVMWSDFDIGPVQNSITEQPGGSVKEDYMNYGITISFLNGPR